MNGPTGIAVVDKEAGVTSHDVVAAARRQLDTRKVGHSGTLDPDATGLLILGVGAATRLLRFLTVLPKRYVADVVLGIETATLDAGGPVTATHDMSAVTNADVAEAAKHFVGEIEQIPPMVSAVKVDGKRLHELAREGKEVERAPRRVTVHELRISEPRCAEADFTMEVSCSSGTYVRTLAADLGSALGGGAHVFALRRVAVGGFGEADAAPLEDLRLLTPAEGLRDYPAIVADEHTVAAVRHGQPVDPERFSGPGPWRVLDSDGRLIAVFERKAGSPRSAVVLS